MRVSVVVPTYRRPELLARCLAALAGQETGPHEIDVLVADDAGDPLTEQIVQQHTSAKIHMRLARVNQRHGPAAARNAGWRASQGEIIAFTDDDCEPDRHWIERGVAPLADPSVVAVTGRTVVPLPSDPTDHEYTMAGLERGEFITANCFCRRHALQQIGGFDESFTAAWREDSDLHFRLLDLGGHIVRADDAIVVHPVRKAAWGSSLRQQSKACFDALLWSKHPDHCRQRIEPICPLTYYVMVIAAVLAIALCIVGQGGAALVLAAVWLAFTGRFAYRRLRRTSRSPAHIAEMLVTSAAIPFLCVYWRLYGAVKFGWARN